MLIKAVELLTDLVGGYGDTAAASAWEIHEVAHKAVAKFSVKDTVGEADVLEKLFFLIEGFFGAGADQHDGGNGGDDVQVADHVGSCPLVHAAAACVGIDHQLVYAQLLVDSADHNSLIDRLIVTSDEVAVEIGVQVVHVLYIWKWIKCKNIVYIESVLWQSQIALKEQLGTVDHGMHEKIFSFRHMSYFVPGEDLVHWQAVAVLHDLLAGCALLLIYKVADEKVYGL